MSILNAKDEQFSLSEDGRVLFQEKHGSPLPGQPVGVIRKGDHILKPVAVVEEGNLPGGAERHAVAERLQRWLEAHIAGVLEPLVALDEDRAASVKVADEAPAESGPVEAEASAAAPKEEAAPKAVLSGAARGIAFQVREALGILPREDVQDLIDGLDQEGRAALRARKIRLGPILVFIPALNKPAAVRLRAKLWALYHDRALPVEVPKDGVVSTKVDPGVIDRRFYQAIGYPVYGSRAIRIDMLDRVIVAVYDSAKDGKFQAQHQMAEWLGTPIDDLYEILEAMGHRKMEEGRDSKKEEDAGAPAEVAAETEVKTGSESESDAGDVAPDSDPAVREGEAPKPEENKKPDLAWFRLKRGKANARPMKKPFKVHQGARKDRHGQDAERKKGKKANRNPKGKEYKQAMMSTGPKVKPEDSPFAILEQLKKKS